MDKKYDQNSALEFISKGLLDEELFDNFKTEPIVDLMEFIISPNYLGLSTPSDRQFEIIERATSIYHDDPYKFTEIVIQSGKSSGKDWMSRIILLRVIYKLLNLKIPQEYYGIDKYSGIYCINVAPSGDNAEIIFFTGLKPIVENSPYFKSMGDTVKILNKEIVFPKNLHCISTNSSFASFEGLNVFIAVLDEIDEFKDESEMRGIPELREKKTAQGIYKRARAGTQSRFAGYGKVILLSWPRYKNSFIQQRFKQGLLEEHTYVPYKDDYQPLATWDVSPVTSREKLEDEFKKDPKYAAAVYECRPGYAEDMFFEDEEKLLSAFNAQYGVGEAIVKVSEKENENNFDSLLSGDYKLDGGALCIHVDLAVTKNKAAIGVAHKVAQGSTNDDMRTYESIIKLDGMNYYYPNETTGEIDFQIIKNDILKIKRNGYKIGLVTFDHYQSWEMRQELRKIGIKCEFLSLDRTSAAYDTFQDVVYAGDFQGFYDTILIYELLRLQKIFGRKIVAQSNLAKDAADACAGACFNAVALPFQSAVDGGNLAAAFTTNNKKEEDVGVLTPTPESIMMKKEEYIICDNCIERLAWSNNSDKTEIINGMSKVKTVICFVCREEVEQ